MTSMDKTPVVAQFVASTLRLVTQDFSKIAGSCSHDRGKPCHYYRRNSGENGCIVVTGLAPVILPFEKPYLVTI